MASCYPNQLAQSLAKGAPAVVLLWGEDAGAIRQAVQAVVQATGIAADDPFSASTFTLADVAADPAALTDACLTIGFGGGNKLVRLMPASGDESAAQLTPLKESVQALLAGPTEGYTLILPLPKLLDKKHALVVAAEKHPAALSVRFFADNARDIAQHAQTALNAASKRLTPQAQALLTENLGADREIATRELEKLVLYAGEESEITAEMVEASLAGAIAGGAFRLADAVGSRNTALADRLIEHLLEEGEDLNQAFVLTLRHLAKLATLQAALKGGAAPDAAFAQLKPPTPRPLQAALLQQATTYPAGRLAQLPKLSVETLQQARSGLVPSQLTLRRTLLSLAT